MSVNYFQQLQMPEQLDLDMIQLEEHHEAALSLVHPDQFIGMPEALRQAAQEHAERINEAYYSLKNEQTRIAHWLALKDINISAYQPNSTQLMQQWTYREAIDDGQVSLETIQNDCRHAYQALLEASQQALETAVICERYVQWLFLRRCDLTEKGQS